MGLSKDVNADFCDFDDDDEGEKIIDFQEEIMFHHKCYNCYRFSCCGGNSIYKANCWAEDLKQDMTIHGIQQVYKY